MLARRVRTDGFFDPCISTLAAKPPAGPDWVHEINEYQSLCFGRATRGLSVMLSALIRQSY
jgi:hypothetical protein